MDQKEGGLGQGLPSVQFSYANLKLIFLTQGDGPYQLAFGSEKASYPSFDVTPLMSLIKLNDKKEIPEAQLGALVNHDLTGTGPKGLSAKSPVLKVVLWIALVGGVAILGYIATRLLKQIDQGPKV